MSGRSGGMQLVWEGGADEYIMDDVTKVSMTSNKKRKTSMAVLWFHSTYGGKSTYLLENFDVSLLRNDKRLAPMALVSCECMGMPPGPL